MTRNALLALAAAALLAACAEGGKRADFPSEWEQKNERFLKGEADARVPEPPSYPKDEDLMPFFVSSATDNKFFVDRRSLSIRDGLVHYTLVVRTPSGVDNVFFEALNCKEREYRNYARGTSARSWIVRPTEWRKIGALQNVAQNTLHWEYFCPNRIPVGTTAEGIAALEKGGHPWSKKPDTAGGAR